MSLTSLHARELPYLSHIPTDGRSIPSLPFLDKEGAWHEYVSQPDGTLFEVRPVDAIAVLFLSQGHPPTPRDAHLPLFHLVVQHFSFEDTWATLEGIKQDYLNAFASLHKYFVLSNYTATEQDFLPHVMVGTELEFAFSNHRAFYDLIHKMTSSICRRAFIEGGRGRRVRPANMPDSFSRILKKSDADLASKYHLPAPLIAFYRSREDMFRRLCKIRDNIIHHGHSTDFIFSLPDGFALSLEDNNLWADLHTVSIWPENLVKPNGLASVLGLLVFLLDDMETAMTALVKGLVKSFTQLPQSLAGGYNVHLRDHLLVHRSWLPEYREQHRCDPASVLQRCASEWSKKPCAK